MTDISIAPEVIEAAADALFAAREEIQLLGGLGHDSRMKRERARAEVAIRAADKERGLRVERSVMVGYFSQDRVPLEDGEVPDPCHELQERVTSDWRPVEVGSDEEIDRP